MIYPRQFVPRAPNDPVDDRSSVLDSSDGTIAHVVDTFFLEHRHQHPLEWIVGVDFTGRLVAAPIDDAPDLDAAARAELAYGEVTGSRVPRTFDAEALYVFEVQLVEQTADAPGANDPVYLYGALRGPCPGSGAQPARIEGQLTVTRADVLSGLIDGAAHAWRYGGASAPAGRCLHFIVPADRPEELGAGRGLVLAYALMPPDLWFPAPSNEVLIAQILFDLLSGMQKDFGAKNGAEVLTETLPVPNRAAVIAGLESDGYEIDGDSAVRKPRGGFKRMLASVVGGDRVAIPPEGTVDDFLGIARAMLEHLEGWPSAAFRTLRTRIRIGGAPAPRALARQARAPRSTIATRASAAAAAAVADPSLTWTQDFIAAHGNAGKSRLTSARPPVSTQAPSWMQDFGKSASPATTRSVTVELLGAEPSSPDWMKDFDPK